VICQKIGYFRQVVFIKKSEVGAEFAGDDRFAAIGAGIVNNLSAY